MKLVVDANILLAAIIRDGMTRKLLSGQEHDLIAPEFILDEIEENSEMLLEKTGFGNAELQELADVILALVRIVPVAQEHRSRAGQFSPDSDDVAYLALCLQENCPLWSNDARLKQQDHVRVISTEELLKKMG